MDRKEMLYAFIKEEEYRPMKGKEIAALFCVPKKERAKFHALTEKPDPDLTHRAPVQ